MTSHSAEAMAAAFEEERPYLRRLAYGTLGSVAEADDVVQEAWLRLQRVGSEEIGNLRAWLTTVVGRLALDALGSARRRRERYIGPWLPEPLVEDRASEDPSDRVSLDEQVTTALLVVLERLSPAERTAFVLHDVFGLPFDDVAGIVGRSPSAVRQLAVRARRHVEAGTPRFPASREEHGRVVAAFAMAWQAGDVDALLEVLDPAVTFRSDGGGKVIAARRPVDGARRVARTLVAFTQTHAARGKETRGGFVAVNGLPGLLLHDGETLGVVSITIDDGRIVAIDIVRNPEKLQHVSLRLDGERDEAGAAGEGV